MKNILLPTDFSDNSYLAMDYAMRLFTGQSMNFTVLNIQKSSEYIMDDLMAASPGSSVHEAISADNKAELDMVVERYRAEYSSEEYKIEGVFDFDVFIDGIAQTVDSREIELIVMGTNGASGAREAIFGSNTLQVIRNIQCPVLAIPKVYKYRQPQQVMLTVVDEQLPSNTAINSLKKIMKLHNPELHVLHVSSAESSISENTNEKLSEIFDGFDITYHYLSGIPVPMAIQSFIQLKQVDLHCLLIEQRSFLDRFIHGSDTSRISYGTQVPLLVVHD